MKNYYEVLEISSIASPEIIEKAYKTLAKKYHPDVQEESQKKLAEEKFKSIGEAYEILSDVNKRAEYDAKYNLFVQNSKKEAEASNYNQTTNHFVETENINTQTTAPSNIQNEEQFNKAQQKMYNEMRREMSEAVNKAYNDAYITRLKDYGYKIKYKKTFKQKFKSFVTILITILVLAIASFIIWNIPSIKKELISIYNENPVINWIMNIFLK